jgi:uncharacterized protein YbjT (DUF2867 family)
MRVAVVGATGTAGGPAAKSLKAAGHEVRALSRSSNDHPVDLLDGSGLDEALAGVEVVVDASNAGPRVAPARALLVDGGRRLLQAEKRVGVGHHICLSIVGIDDFPLGYYRVKVEQEGLVRGGGVPFSIVRATQFHSFVAFNFASMARLGLLPRIDAPLQPVDVDELAGLVAELTGEAPTGTTMTLAGPEIRPIGDLALAWKQHKRSRAVRVPMPLIGGVGRALRAGALTDAEPDRRGAVTFEQALASGQG